MKDMVSTMDQFPFFDGSVQAQQKKGIRELNIEELELRAVLKLMESKFN